ncbi:SDR family NAD(P)-dependent oxidoreductase [Ochrobactrum soli]|uniref:SDR family NAD(P)-dependent oxidoreductase n=1 Tax=Ochrobactrum soli TaxID=2448455 RepID=A0A849KT74_9HYPH|nr:SDR family NAD(P)-dependent oxidoreductase [[Ochrobactrum] soli]NNU63210.1 SDR family NAD(P)-dependent oxidoreductase [[Ochrobactrum] soli]
MTEPLARPKRKNPLARTRQPLLPPSARSRTAHGLTLAAAEGRFALQRCEECRQFTYPPHDACPNCLSHKLAFVDAPSGGKLVSATTIHITSDSYFRERTPWRQGIVTSECGPQIIANLHGECVEGDKVRLTLQLDKAGQPVICALPLKGTDDMLDDPAWRELTADPKFRRVLITDGRNSVGQALAQSLVRAGAARVFVGVSEPWKPFPGEHMLRAIEGVEIVPLDVTDEQSVSDLAAVIGAKIDILINTADHTRPVQLFDPSGARKLMEGAEVMLAGSMRLAQAFGPIMVSRGADGTNSAAAWVNVLSVYAFSNLPAYGALSMLNAACLSLSHWLRAELRPGGIKLLNAFAGPLDTEWFQTVPPPKVAPIQLAEAILDGLRRGLEEIYVGDVAKDVRDRFAANPKALEREIGL